MNQRITEQKFAEYYDTYLSAIFRFCYFKTKDKELATEITQQTFLKAWNHAKEGGNLDNVKAFLYRIAGNMVIDWYRKHKSERLDPLIEDGFDPVDLEADTGKEAEINWAMAMLDKLSDGDKEIIIWKYIDDLSPKEIAGFLNIKENAVSVRIHRAIERLRKVLNNDNE